MAKHFAGLVTLMGVDEDDFEAWYRWWHPRVLAAVWVACGDADVAEDSADEAFVRVLVHQGRVQTMESPEGWVFRVAMNVMRRRLRRRALERRLLRSHSPSTQTAAAGEQAEVWDAIRRLPERQRTAVVLRFVADLTEADIATAMGVTRGSVAATLAAARSHLAGVLGDSDPHHDTHTEAPHA